MHLLSVALVRASAKRPEGKCLFTFIGAGLLTLLEMKSVHVIYQAYILNKYVV